MPRPSYNSRFSIDIDPATAAQAVPILGSENFRRFTILIEEAGAGVADLMGALSGSATKVPLNDILTAGNKLDPGETNNAGFTIIKDANGDAIFTGLGDGLYQLEIATRMPGGLLLDFTGLNGGGDTKVTVLMSGNAVVAGSPRGA